MQEVKSVQLLTVSKLRRASRPSLLMAKTRANGFFAVRGEKSTTTCPAARNTLNLSISLISVTVNGKGFFEICCSSSNGMDNSFNVELPLRAIKSLIQEVARVAWVGAILGRYKKSCSKRAGGIAKSVGLLNAQRHIPCRVGRIAHHAPVVIGCAISPPGRPTFAQAALGCIDSLPGQPFGISVFDAQCFSYFPACPHQGCDEPGAIFLGQIRIGDAPEPAAHHEIPVVRRYGVGRGWKGRRHACRIAWDGRKKARAGRAGLIVSG